MARASLHRERTVSATWVRGVLHAFAEHGLDVDAVCREAGIDRATIERDGVACASARLSQLWEAAVERSGNPALGLLASTPAHPASFDVVGYAIMSSATLLDGLGRLQRYLRLVADDHVIEVKPEGPEYRLTVEIGGGGRPVPRARYDSVFMTLLAFSRWMLGRELHFSRMAFSQGAPADARPYARTFRCPVRFGAPTNCVLFARADALAPLPTANPVLMAMLDQTASQRLRDLDNGAVEQRVADLVRRALPDGEPGRADIAALLHISERTLQRQLAEAGTSFQQVLDGTRRELAGHYLAQSHISLGEVAYLLGFAEPSVFTRACKRWFQAAPGQVRTRLAAGER